MPANRRDFLRSSLAASTLVSMGASTVPGFLTNSARAADGSKSNDRVLVVIQLIGGNDGLNTVVPHKLDGYAKARRALRLPSGQIHKLSDEIGLHPSMGEMAKLVEMGKASVVQGVQLLNPDRSHFRSMEIWESARLEYGSLETGWLGRGPRRPARRGRQRHPRPAHRRPVLPFWPSRRRPRSPRSRPSNNTASRSAATCAFEARSPRRPRTGRPTRPSRGHPCSASSAAARSPRMTQARETEQLDKDKGSKTTYPNFNLAKRLELIARIIKAGFGTRIYYTSIDGFDTHANQLGNPTRRW